MTVTAVDERLLTPERLAELRAGAEKATPGEVLPRGDTNPCIKVASDEVLAWLRSIADAHGFSDRETVAVQFAWDESLGYADTGQRMHRIAVPELIVMVSNIRDSRAPTNPSPSTAIALIDALEAARKEIAGLREGLRPTAGMMGAIIPYLAPDTSIDEVRQKLTEAMNDWRSE